MQHFKLPRPQGYRLYKTDTKVTRVKRNLTSLQNRKFCSLYNKIPLHNDLPTSIISTNRNYGILKSAFIMRHTF